MEPITALGLMSGTSMDGIDLALLRTDGERMVERGPSHFVAYDAAFRKRIAAALVEAKTIGADRTERPGDLADLERDITLRHAEAVADFLKDRALPRPDLIGFHGQTVLHRPHQALTVQLGDGPLLARRTGMPVVYDMRAADMAAGGQGAPLVPAYHLALAASLPVHMRARPVCFVNIGGISNITYVDGDEPPIAFDSGPGNALIDQWVQREAGIPYDEGGRIAGEGRAVRAVIDAYLAAPFFTKAGPKSLDRDDFTLDGMAGLELSDGARTLAAVTAQAILRAADHLPRPPGMWIACGGGRRNGVIMADLADGARLAGAGAILAEDVSLDGDAMEAEAWAYLAVRARRGLPLTWPTTTGCRKPTPGGVTAATAADFPEPRSPES